MSLTKEAEQLIKIIEAPADKHQLTLAEIEHMTDEQAGKLMKDILTGFNDLAKHVEHKEQN